MASTKPRRFKILVGCNYPTKAGEVRRVPDEVVDDVPADVVDAWLAEHVIEETK